MSGLGTAAARRRHGRHERDSRVAVLVAIVTILSTVAWLCGADEAASNYWMIQLETFTQLNSRLSMYPRFWSGLTELGDALIIMLLLTPILLFRPAVWAAMVGAIPVAVMLSRGGKELAAIPRPAAVLDPQTFVIIGDMLSGQNSFPSGHATTVFVAATVLAVALLREAPSRIRLLLTIFLMIVVPAAAISRVAVGAHWPLDIVAGGVCGYLSGMSGMILVQRYPARWRWILEPRQGRHMGGALLFLSAALVVRIADRQSDVMLLSFVALTLGLTTSLTLIWRYRPVRWVTVRVPS